MKTVQLNYSAPRPFFVGTFQYRTSRSMVGAIAFFGFGLGFSYIGLFKDPNWLGRIFLGGFGIACISVSVFLIYKWIRRREVLMRVTEEGVEYGRKHWPWHQVALIGGRAWTPGVALLMQAHGARPRTLPTTPPMTAEQFEKLMTLIQMYLADCHPEVKVDQQIHTDE